MLMKHEEIYSVGELAKATGLTVRTLQHYDNIGLLRAGGRTEGGRRYYTKRDVVRLTQITIYKSIGFSLSDIREKLTDDPEPTELAKVFSMQIPILQKKMDDLHMAIAVLFTSVNLFDIGKEPPLEILAELIRTTEGSGLTEWTDFPFDPALSHMASSKGLDTLHGAMGFYHTMRELLIEAIALQSSDTAADDPQAQTLAGNWWENVILLMVNDTPGASDALLTVNSSRDQWPVADRKLYEMAEPFIESALAVYMEKNNFQLPVKEDDKID